VFRRIFIGIACLLALTSMQATSRGQTLTLELYPLTGELRLLNDTNAPIPFVYYEINSPSGGLNSAANVWTSISGHYDASGNGFIDPVNNWTTLPFGTTKLAEGAVHGPGGSLPAYRSIGLGYVWNPNVATAASIVPTFLEPGNDNPIPIEKMVAVDGDYDTNLVVNQQDYSIWSILFGNTTHPKADGNHNGIVDAADYTVWRDHVGASALADGLGSLSAAAVPEPTCMLLGIAGIGGVTGYQLVRRRTGRR
jgi:hypothetical protein